MQVYLDASNISLGPTHEEGRGQSPNTSLEICRTISRRCHICQELFSFLIWGGSRLSPFSFPIFIPKDPAPPKFLRSFQCDIQQFNDVPGPCLVPSQNAPTPDDHSVYRQRCRAASKKIGSSADSKIKSSQSMKSALITLHT